MRWLVSRSGEVFFKMVDEVICEFGIGWVDLVFFIFDIEEGNYVVYNFVIGYVFEIYSGFVFFLIELYFVEVFVEFFDDIVFLFFEFDEVFFFGEVENFLVYFGLEENIVGGEFVDGFIYFRYDSDNIVSCFFVSVFLSSIIKIWGIDDGLFGSFVCVCFFGNYYVVVEYVIIIWYGGVVIFGGLVIGEVGIGIVSIIEIVVSN